MMHRRELITGLISLVAAPAIIRADNLMKIKVIDVFDPKEAFAKIHTAWDIGIMDQNCFATYMYLKDGSIKVLELGYQDIFK